jgi:hypothetical protein
VDHKDRKALLVRLEVPALLVRPALLAQLALKANEVRLAPRVCKALPVTQTF